MLVYCSSFLTYQRECEEAAANGFQKFRVEGVRSAGAQPVIELAPAGGVISS
jgi:hypothetical protein